VSDARDFQAAERDELPKPIEEAVRDAEWRDAALAKIAEPPGGTPPEPEPTSRVEAFQRRMAEQAEAEQERATRVSRAMHQNPSPPVPDPLREQAARSYARHRRARKHGRVRWFRPR
jgi:hypothetical protein